MYSPPSSGLCLLTASGVAAPLPPSYNQFSTLLPEIPFYNANQMTAFPLHDPLQCPGSIPAPLTQIIEPCLSSPSCSFILPYPIIFTPENAMRSHLWDSSLVGIFFIPSSSGYTRQYRAYNEEMRKPL